MRRILLESKYAQTHTLTNQKYGRCYSLSHAFKQEALTCAGTAGWRLFHSRDCLQPSLSVSVGVKHTNACVSQFCAVPIVSSRLIIHTHMCMLKSRVHLPHQCAVPLSQPGWCLCTPPTTSHTGALSSHHWLPDQEIHRYTYYMSCYTNTRTVCCCEWWTAWTQVLFAIIWCSKTLS